MSTQTHINPRLVAALSLCLAASAQAAPLHHPEKPTYPYEKCYGVASAGHNDCFTSSNSCAGAAAQERQADAWIYVPEGSCQRITGGSLSPRSS